MSRARDWIRLSRPFTLLAPAIGMASGSLVALGVPSMEIPAGATRASVLIDHLPRIAAGVALAVLLNAASNAVNQIFDLAIDRVNKPDRPLPSGALTVRQAAIFAALTGLAALLIAAWLPDPTLLIVAFTAIVVWSYSGPPLRTKRFWWAANPTIAIPRGSLLFLAGWSAVRGGDHLWGMLPIVLAAMYGLFILGAATTKDYADIPGDRAEGCVTLPIRFGVRRSVWIIAPFLVLPWFLLPVGVLAHGEIDTGDVVHAGLGCALALWGAWVVHLLLRDPDELTSGRVHPSWKHMYLMMVVSQVGVAAGFWVPR